MTVIRKILVAITFLLCISNSYAVVYCSKQVTSSDGKKSVVVTCKSLGDSKYRVEISSKDVIAQIVSTNMYCNPGTINIGSKLALQSDKKTILSSDFTCASSPEIYVGAFTLKFLTATCNFDITGAEFSDCDMSAPVWDADPYLLCGGKRQISLMTSTHDDTGVAGYKITIDGCDMDSPLAVPVQKHSGAISVSLLKCRITLDETSDYTATIVPYDRIGNEGEAKVVTGIKLKEAEPVVMESVSCGAITPTTIQLVPVTSGGVPASYQVTYGTSTVKYDGSGSFTVEGLEPSTEYTFTVNAVDGCGNVSATSATTTCITTYSPHGGADAATELDEKEFRPTSTGNCGTSIAGGTAFSVAGASGKFSHTIEEIDKFGELTLARTFTEAYSNGYFHEAGTPSEGENQYAIVSNPKVLNGNYRRITDKKNRLVLALGQDPSGNQYQMLTLRRNHLENGSFRISFNVEDLTDGTQCPQGGLPNMRQLWIHATQNGTVIYDGPHEFTVGTSKQFTVSGNAQKGDVVAVEIKARFLSSCTAIAISDLTIYGCMERAIETPDGFSTYCENSDVTLMAVGTTATKFKWQSSPNNSDWTDLQGVGDGDIISVTATLGNMYYRYVELDGSKKESQVFNLLGQVCCTYLAEQTTVWKETFGNGTGRWQNPNVKNHSFVPGITTKIDDGGYAVVSNSNDACPSCCAWPANKTDHTGDTNGGFLVINVKNVKPPVLIYSQTITPADGFCKSTYYNLSLFASNLSAASNLPSSFMFEVVDAATGNVLGRGETGDVNSFGMESWLNYGTSFAPENSTSVIINIYNTGEAGYGNDVVLDDIAVSVCNAKVDLYAAYPKIDATVQCGEPAVLTAVPDGNMQTFFGTDKPYCLWLKSTDGGSTFSIVNEASGYGNDKYEYTSVEGENATFRVILAKTEDDALKIYRGDPIEECVIYTKTNLASVRCNGCVEPQFVLPATTECSADKQSYTISISVDTGTLTCDCASAKITHTGNDWKFAGIPKDVDVKITATNGNCSSSTTVTAPDCSCPPIDARIESDDIILTCTHTEVVLKALPDDMEYLWSTAEATQTITVTTAGKYTVEVKDALTGCSKVADIDVTEDKEIGAKIESDNTVLTCSHTEVVLKALPDDMEYLWSTAETTQSITVNTAGKYTVEVKETLTGCSGVAMVDVTESITYPKFEVQTPNEVTEPATFFLPNAVISQDCDVMEYYSDQAMTKPVADKTISGVGDYDFYLRGVNNDGCVSEPQMVKVIIKARPVPPPPVPECELEIPVYFSPNGDGLNDEWIIKNIDCYPNAIVEIYDRFNKLLIRCKGSEQKWDGTYNGHPMPMTDYWYIIIDEKLGRRSGHFTLKR